MIALGFYKNGPRLVLWFELIDHGKGVGMGPPDLFKNLAVIKWNFRRGQFVDLIAGGLAFSAPDAPGDVMQNPKASGMTRKMGGGGCFCLGGEGHLAPHSCAHPAKKLSSRNSHGVLFLYGRLG
jgi:hypothetical protein